MTKEELEKQIVEAGNHLPVSETNLGWITSPEFIAYLRSWTELYAYYARHADETKYLYFEVVSSYLGITRLLNRLLRNPKHAAHVDMIEEALGSLEYTMDGITSVGYGQINNPPLSKAVLPVTPQTSEEASTPKTEIEKRIIETLYTLKISENDVRWIAPPEFTACIDAWNDLYGYYMKHDGETKYLYFEVVAAYLAITRLLNRLLRNPKFSTQTDFIEETLGEFEYIMDGLTTEGYRQLNNPPIS